MSRQGQLKILNHPLIQHKLTLMRCTDTPSNSFRRLLKEISILMSYEVFRDLPLKNIITNTPIQSMRSPVLSEKTLCLVPILRAGNGMLDGFIEIVSGALVGHIGLYRDEETLKAHDYYINLPKGIGNAKTIILDPMLATGNSANAAISIIKKHGATNVVFVSILAAPEGVKTLEQKHPDVQIYTCCLDERLNDNGYITPGLGDAGDRLYGTI